MRSQTPKVLHRICGREMVSLVVDAATQAGLDAVVVVPQDAQAVREALGDTVRYAEQSEPLGSGHALLQTRSAMGGVDNVVVLSGDVPLIRPETLGRLIGLHDEREACVTLLTSTVAKPDGAGRVVRSPSGAVRGIVEESDADEATLAISEINSGAYCFRASWLWEHLAELAPSRKGEIYLTDLIVVAAQQGMVVESIQSEDSEEMLGVDTRVQLAEAAAVLRRRILEGWMTYGVTMPDPASVYVDATVELGQDSAVLPNTHITGRSRVGRGCEIGPNSIVSDALLGDDCKVLASVIDGSTLEDGVEVGPFSHIRPGSHLERGVHIGNYAEVKASRLGPDTRSGHFSYIGDADVGANVNIGAGTVTCNYDGRQKNRTIIGDGAFIGCDSMLVAPVNIGARSVTGAGAVVTKDVPADTLVKGVPARVAGGRGRKRVTKADSPGTNDRRDV